MAPASTYDICKGAAVRAALGLLTQEELAAALEVDVRTLQTWRAEGTGPVYSKPNKSVFYRVEDVLKWIARNMPVVPAQVRSLEIRPVTVDDGVHAVGM